ncbi:MAG: hypothetical protein KDA27_00955 [Candidatus Eisenbacteria bacterium]|uniref:Uncharacterized protein n=1 Tax=Eiseniibacteriota bacterium TaxID=2212470 RepID=A0A956SBH9_UNCEI|nr:hypothetical protein [Candidatus Eisenbacteria bacterium]
MISHIILPQHRLILVKTSGEVTFDQAVALRHDIHGDPLYQREFDGLTDLRTQVSGLTAHDVKRFVDALQSEPTHCTGRWAFVVDEPTQTALSYYYGQLRDKGRSTNVFSTSDAALDWLRVERKGEVSELLEDLG